MFSCCCCCCCCSYCYCCCHCHCCCCYRRFFANIRVVVFVAYTDICCYSATATAPAPESFNMSSGTCNIKVKNYLPRFTVIEFQAPHPFTILVVRVRHYRSFESRFLDIIDTTVVYVNSHVLDDKLSN